MARKSWTPEEDQFLRDRYDTTFTRTIAEQLGLKVTDKFTMEG